MMSIYRMSDAPPDWAQDDPSQPDYIKNKLQLVAGENIVLKQVGNKVVISAVGGSYPDDPEQPDDPINPDDPIIPEEPDDPVVDDSTIVGKIIKNSIPVFTGAGENNEEVAYQTLDGSKVDYTKEGFYVNSTNDIITSAGYQVIFEPANEPQKILIISEANQ